VNVPKLYDKQSGECLGTITRAELQFLIDDLEEEDSTDRDYYIDQATLEWFQEHGGDAKLMALLRTALGDREGMDIRWTDD
jgi:processive 1,2-diacylglycerol beta-glucosyltransferase